MKYSIIIPCRNGEKYIDKCLSSVLSQTYTNYEIIVVQNGSTDNSVSILGDYRKKYGIKVINLEKEGISHARNKAIKQAIGDYVLFVDIDDWIDPNLLNELSHIDSSVDLIRFQAVMIDSNSTVWEKYITNPYNNKAGVDALVQMCKNNEIFSPSWLYCYKREYWISMNFRFADGKVQEDLGLTSQILFNAKSVVSIDFIGYYYFRSNNSEMRNDDYEKTKRKAWDVLYHFDFLYKNVICKIKNEQDKIIVHRYFLNVLHNKLTKLVENDRDIYYGEIDKRSMK